MMSWWSDIVETIHRIINARIERLNTSEIGQIVEYDPATNLAKIQPVCKVIQTFDGESSRIVTQQPLTDVPVFQHGSGNFHLTIAPVVGQYGAIVYSKHDMQNWMAKGGVVDPASNRKHNTSDCVFFPGFYPPSDAPYEVETDRISLRRDDGTVEISVLEDSVEIITPDGSIIIDSDGVVIEHDAISLGDGATEAAVFGDAFKITYDAHVHSTAFGPSGPPAVPLPANNLSAKVKVG